MARTSSAKKAQRAALRRHVFNVRRKDDMKDAIKNVAKLVTKKDKKGTESLLPGLYQAIDKSAKNGVIKKNTAARIKSRIMKRFQAIDG